MAKIDRYSGNVQAFGSQSQGTERTVFGDDAQSDSLDANITADFLRGWGIVGVNENPKKQDFNALAFTLGQFIAYLHQRGVPEWDADQEYFEGSVVTTLVGAYQLKSGGDGTVNPDTDDGTNWTRAPTQADVDQRTIYVGSVTQLNALLPLTDGQRVEVTEFWPDSGVGKNAFAWDAGRSKAGHTGGTVIDPDKLSELGGVGVFGSYFTPAATGAGCFVSLSEVATFEQFGVTGGGTIADTVALNAAVAATPRSVSEVGGADYLIDGPLLIPSGRETELDLKRSTLRLANAANCYLIENADHTQAIPRLEINNVILDGNGDNQTRDYVGGYTVGYFGFGVAVTLVGVLRMSGWKLVETNAWGVAYFLCDDVEFNDFECDQTTILSRNGDGITGSARKIKVNGVRGFCNDDMVGVTTGRASLAGNDVMVAGSIDVEEIEIRNVTGVSKAGVKPLSAVGIYGTNGQTVKSLVVDGIYGSFDNHVWRVSNYWPLDGTFTVRSAKFANVYADSDKDDTFEVIDVTNLNKLTLENFFYLKEAAGGHDFVKITNSRVRDLTINGYTQYAYNENKALVYVAPQDSLNFLGVDKLTVNDYRGDTLTTDAFRPIILKADWVGNTLPIALVLSSLKTENDPLQAKFTFIEKVYDAAGSTGVPSLDIAGPHEVRAGLTLLNSWTLFSGTDVSQDGVFVKTSGGKSRLSGFIKAGTKTGGTVILSGIPEVLRPENREWFALADVNASGNHHLNVYVTPAGDLVINNEVGTGDTSQLFNLSQCVW